MNQPHIALGTVLLLDDLRLQVVRFDGPYLMLSDGNRITRQTAEMAWEQTRDRVTKADRD